MESSQDQGVSYHPDIPMEHDVTIDDTTLIDKYFTTGVDGNRYHPFVVKMINNVRVYHAQKARMTFVEELDSDLPSIWSEPLSIRDLERFSIQYGCNLASRFIHYPTNIILEAEKCLNKILMMECTPDELSSKPTIILSLNDNPQIKAVNEISPLDIDCTVTIEGVVIRATNVKPLMSYAAFQCKTKNPDGSRQCSHIEEVPIIDRKVLMPQECVRCRKNYSELCYHKSKFSNRQVIKIQDVKSTTSQWSQNQGIIAFVHDPLIDIAKPGDTVQLTGLFRASQSRVRPTQQIVKALCKTYIDVIHIDKIETVSRSLTSITETQFRELAKRERLLKVFAPGIAMLDHVKTGLLCSLVGGTSSPDDPSQRNSIHILLCGDPATAKSQLLSAVKALAERSVYVCGRGSSASGLTASVVRDAETNEFLLEPGAVVVADRGICLIDEFDKVDDSARIVLNEVMEQQTVSVAKAGIVCSLNARTSVIASANPIASRFDKNRSIMENLNMPLSLLSRFDLVYLLTDPSDIDYDREIARSLLSHWAPENRADRRSDSETTSIGGSRKSEMELLLQAYIRYARNEIHPTIPTEVKQLMVRVYCQLRKNSSSTVVTPRQLKALVRLSEATAKLELSPVVTEAHVKVAEQLITTSTEYLKHNATEDAMTNAKSTILSLVSQAGSAGVIESDVFDVLSNQGIDRNTFDMVIRMMINERMLITRSGATGTILTAATN